VTFPTWQSAGYGSTTWAATSGTSKNLLIPSGATVGHLAIIVVGMNGLASNNATIAGWTRKAQTTLTGWGDTYCMHSIFWKKLAAGEPNTNAVITLAVQPRGGASIHTFANAEVDSDPFVDLKSSESTTSAQPVLLSCVTTDAENALLTIVGTDTTTITATEPAGFTRRHNGGTTNESGHVAVKENVGAGTNAHQWTLSATNRNNEFLVAIKAAAAVTQAPARPIMSDDRLVATQRSALF